MYYTKQELLECIFGKFKQQISKPTAGYWWTAQHFVRLMNSLSKPIEYGEFISLMKELCSDGIFIIAEQNRDDGEILTFELTEKGEHLLWS